SLCSRFLGSSCRFGVSQSRQSFVAFARQQEAFQIPAKSFPLIELAEELINLLALLLKGGWSGFCCFPLRCPGSHLLSSFSSLPSPCQQTSVTAACSKIEPYYLFLS